MKTSSENITQRPLIMEHNHKDGVQYSCSCHNSDIGSLHSENGNIYYCPMKCEGEKTYPEPGRCPVCNMNLIQVK